MKKALIFIILVIGIMASIIYLVVSKKSTDKSLEAGQNNNPQTEITNNNSIIKNNGKKEDIKTPIERIKETLGIKGEIEIKEEEADYVLPFVGKPKGRLLVTEYNFKEKIKDDEVDLKMKVYFSKDGYFLHAESLKKWDDPHRLTIKQIEEVSEKIVAHQELKELIDFKSLMKELCIRTRVDNCEEFTISIVKYDFPGEFPIRVAIMLNLRGLEGYDLKDPKHSERVFTDLTGHPLVYDNTI